MTKLGTLYGLGVGPGDPELLTLKAVRILNESPVIAYPQKKEGSPSYAYAIAEPYIQGEDKELLGLVFPMTKNQAILTREWNNTIAKIWEKISAGQDVAFITEGDPLIYSTFIHLMREMNDQHPEVDVRIIPGISSVNGAASRLGIPLADGNEKIAIVPATADREEMRKVIEDHDCVVFIKVVKVLEMMVELLEELQLLPHASVISKATAKEEFICRNLAELSPEDLTYLTLMVVRK